MSQSNSFNGNDLMVLFKWGWSRLINKSSLRRSLNLFQDTLNTWRKHEAILRKSME